MELMRKHFLTAALVILACWTFLALLFTPQTYLVNLRSPTPLTIWQSFMAIAVMFYVWAILTPLVLWIGYRLPLEFPRLWRNLLIIFVLAFPISLMQIALVWFGNFLTLSWGAEYRSPIPVLALLVGYGATNVMIYWGVIAVSQVFIYLNRYRERERSLARAQLQSLKTQLNPHFLFNTLNAVTELVYENAAEAEKMIGKLSELLRMTLKTEQAQEIPLYQELEFLRKYLEIQQTLLQERLRIDWQIDPKTYGVYVPNMILQPLVENSIKHGITPRRSGGTIKIESAKDRDFLVLRIEDDGLGLADETVIKEKKSGIGLQNTRMRLQHLYGEGHQFELKSAGPGRGVSVRIQLPLRESGKNYEL